MNLGDRVRLLRGKEEGIVSKIVDDKLIEVEIEDGFNIPVLKKEVVIISQQEASAFGDKQAPRPVTKKTDSPAAKAKGIYLALIPINDKRLSLHFINNTEYTLLFTFSAVSGNRHEGYNGAMVKNKSSAKVCDLDLTGFEQWPTFIVQLLFYRQGVFELQAPFQKKIKFKAASLFKNKKLAPILMREAYLYHIDPTQSTRPIQAEEVKESLFESSSNKNTNTGGLTSPTPVVDLHIEKITEDYLTLSGREILKRQLQKFDETLNEAIISGQGEIVYIHGLGSGTLKKELQKRLKEIPNSDYVDNYNIERFGGGATLVRIT